MIFALFWALQVMSRFLRDDNDPYTDNINEPSQSNNPVSVSADSAIKVPELDAQKKSHTPEIPSNSPTTTEKKESSSSEGIKQANPDIRELIAEKRELEIRNDELSRLIKERSNISSHLENISEILSKKNVVLNDAVTTTKEKSKEIPTTNTIHEESNSKEKDRPEVSKHTSTAQMIEEPKESKKTPEEKTKEHEIKHIDDLESLRKEARLTILDKIKINLRLRRLRNAIFEILKEKANEDNAELSGTTKDN